jgi:hypothetical protein
MDGKRLYRRCEIPKSIRWCPRCGCLLEVAARLAGRTARAGVIDPAYGLALVVLAASAAATASEPIPADPPWRTDPPGLSGTTYQKWTFDDDDNPAAPEILYNPNGGVQAALTVGGQEPYLGPYWYLEVDGAGGVWYASPLTRLNLTIPNSPVIAREIWIEVGYKGQIDDYSFVSVGGGGSIWQLDFAVEGDLWKRFVYYCRDEPGTEADFFSIDISGYIDYASVDTVGGEIPRPSPDFHDDDFIDFFDYSYMAAQWLVRNNLQEWAETSTDLSMNGQVEYKDLAILAGYWLSAIE